MKTNLLPLQTDIGDSSGGWQSNTVQGQADARRIIACVNACAGVPTVVLEMTGATMVPPEEPYSLVKQQRDILLTALKGIQSMMGDEWLRKEFNEARDAIAKADLTQ